jgi:signal transduction histidine kinase
MLCEIKKRFHISAGGLSLSRVFIDIRGEPWRGEQSGHSAPAEEFRQPVVRVHQRASHLARMVESLLFLARADSEARLPMLEQVNMTTWVPQHLLTWSDHIRTKDVICECASSETCSIKAQPALLGELLNILLDNACKYSEPGTLISIELETLQNVVFVKIEDKGCGIEKGDLATIFVPVCRSVEARRRGIEGVGLGLSIAKRLAEVFNAELTVKSVSGQGSCFILQFTSEASNKTDDRSVFRGKSMNPTLPATTLTMGRNP